MDITKITFPLYKLRSYLQIEKSPLGLVKVTTIKGTYILDDRSINEPFHKRRLKLLEAYPREKIYKLKEKVLYLRQLVKYKSGTTFLDYNGNILKYGKSTKLYTIKSHKITKKEYYNNWTIINVSNIELPFLIAEPLYENITHASIMDTDWGPFLYDLTNTWHEPYKRKI